jgi:hypothetical protein
MRKINYHSINAASLYVRIVSFLTEFCCNNISLWGPVCKNIFIGKDNMDNLINGQCGSAKTKLTPSDQERETRYYVLG